MNIVFFGSSQFSISSLEALIKSGFQVSCVVTQPDKKKGRHLQLGETEVKELARASGLKIYQPDDINSKEAVKFLAGLKADLFVVIAYGQILSKEVLDLPKIFAINVHASLLPKYRGAAPINWAIIDGEKETGVTVIKLIEKMDAGPIIIQNTLKIGQDDTAVNLSEKLSELGSKVLLESIELINNKKYQLCPQNDKQVTFAPKLKKEDGLIDWGKTAKEIHDITRGCSPWPGAYTYYKGKILKLFKTNILSSVANQRFTEPGTIKGMHNNEIVVATGKDDLTIQELQLEGKRGMSSKEFLSGHKIKAGERFDKK